MAISAAMVKELRERTGAGMMECKKALVETDGDLDAAIDAMRKSGMAKADKKSGRTAADGLVVIKVSDDAKKAAIVEVNSETDFVAKGDDFINFASHIAQSVLDNAPADLGALLALPGLGEASIEESRKALISKLGENMNVRRFQVINAKGTISSYMHGARIGVVTDVDGGADDLGKDLAMHIAASRPMCLSEAEVDPEVIAAERKIFVAQAAESGKPPEIVEKMVDGRVKKFLKENTLVGQPFIKDPDQSVEQLLKKSGATISSFVRFEVGEGIEKKTENFADEVMAQIKG